MKTRTKFVVFLLSWTTGLAFAQTALVEPNRIVLNNGDLTITADITKGNVFNGSEDTDTGVVSFFGTVTPQDSGYLVDVVVSKQAKDRYASQSLTTSVRLDNSEPVFIGGSANDVFSIRLMQDTE
ncbi:MULTISPECIES: hypothetical protein [Vibrio]|uniref:Uncharacterized protein n=2 Tax=Vibrio TaxID=662 RepID=U3BLA3_VIBPR|nr:MULTISPECIES: hypothetical protein [Vibrio]NAW59678.1 hypothetical protein [Vibrio sp. V36_P2S2PM302]GAD67388.1 hypothetical protein VPR01S_07_01870 [Vibrio proteolyticus NBRC 13287]